jgi:integrase
MIFLDNNPMTKTYTISCYLDIREAKRKLKEEMQASGKKIPAEGVIKIPAHEKHPVKLRVFHSTTKKRKLFPTDFKLTEDEFDASYLAAKPRGMNKDIRDQLHELEAEANDRAKGIEPFDLDRFTMYLNGGRNSKENVYFHYQTIINDMVKNGQLGTASNYTLSMKSVKACIEHYKKKQSDTLLFSQITPAWLEDYEKYMMKHLGRSPTTVSMYLRALRTVINTAINRKDIPGELYPFGAGKGKYEIPEGANIKKALSQEDLKKLYLAEPKTDEQKQARAFWFFSYLCNGMNVKDISQLRYKAIKDNKFTFVRAKTIKTTKKRPKLIQVVLTDFPLSVIKTYGNKNKDGYVFPILNDKMSDLDRHQAVKNFTRFINQNLKKLALTEGITGDISTYWARHSFSTNIIRQGGSLEFVMEALGHADSKTTKNYFAGFEDESKRDLMEKLLLF